MDVLIVHDAVLPNAAPEMVDTLNQARSVERALREMGLNAHRLSVGADLAALQRQLTVTRPEVVFNLVECIASVDGAAVAVPALLDGLGIPYTGSNAAAQALANDKCMAKGYMRRAGLATPRWFPGPDPFVPGTYLVKTRFEHGSCGIDDGSVAEFASEAELRATVRRRQTALGRPCFGEQYIDGREFNVALIESSAGVHVLPIAEIDYSQFQPDKPRIVGYQAKWVAESFEYAHTPRVFPRLPVQLVEQLQSMSLAAFDLFGLAGYARVDFRVDDNGDPTILEVNPNPCLADDAGFVAALKRGGMSFNGALRALLERAACAAR